MIYDYFRNITFGEPLFFLLFISFPLLIWIRYSKGNKKSAGIKISTLEGIRKSGSAKNAFQNIPFWLRLAALACIITALARPQVKFDETQREGEGIDIILCIDVSGSMTMQDFVPNRIEAAKKVAIDFVNHRPDDRIGVVTFAGEAFTQCPLTTDHYVLISQIQQIRIGLLVDGTAIGDGLAMSVERLRESKAKSKVIVLLTDGVNNTGLIDPSYAKEIAKTYHIKVYTIGIGTNEVAAEALEKIPGNKNSKPGDVGINEKLLQNIASETGGKYFAATNNTGLEAIYKDISQLEKSKVQITTFHRYTEKFYPLVFAALMLLLVESVLRYTIFKKFP
jgi:Ca-activated chloride channel family protein